MSSIELNMGRFVKETIGYVDDLLKDGEMLGIPLPQT